MGRFEMEVRADATPSETTIIVHDDEPDCYLHTDGAKVDVSMSAGVPGTNGNGHPLDGSATHWGRCGTCDRLFIKVAGFGGVYAPISERRTIVLDSDSYLDEASADTKRAAASSFNLEYGSGVRKFPIFTVPNIQTLLGGSFYAPKQRIIKAEIRANCTTTNGTVTIDTYRILRTVVMADVTWNKYDSTNNWGTAGALGDDTDRATGGKYQAAAVVPNTTGWHALVSGSGPTSQFAIDVAARIAQAWYVCVYATSGNDQVYDSVEAGSNKPELRVWYDRYSRQT